MILFFLNRLTIIFYVTETIITLSSPSQLYSIIFLVSSINGLENRYCNYREQLSRMKFCKDRKNFPLLASEYEHYLNVRLSSHDQLDLNINLSPYIILRESFSLMKMKKLYQQSSPILNSAAKNFWNPEHKFHFHILQLSRELCTTSAGMITCHNIPQSYYLARIIDRSSFLVLCSTAGSWSRTLQFCRTFISGTSGGATHGSECTFSFISSRRSLLIGLIAAVAADRVGDFILAPFVQTDPLTPQHCDSFSSAAELLEMLLRNDLSESARPLIAVSEEILRSSSEISGVGFFFSHTSKDWKELKGLLLANFKSDDVEQVARNWGIDLLLDWQATRQYTLFNRLLESSPSSGVVNISDLNCGGSTILIVGDGDFSFSSALAGYAAAQSPSVAQPVVVSSSLDSEAALLRKYPNYLQNIQRLNSSCSSLRSFSVLHGLDATQMERSSLLHGRKFDSIIFNFPYADTEPALDQVRHRRGVSGAQQHEARRDDWDTFWVAKGRHVHLLEQFFRSCKAVLRSRSKQENSGESGSVGVIDSCSSGGSGAVYVSLLLSQVVSWDVEETARQQGYHLRCMYPFNMSYFAQWG